MYQNETFHLRGINWHGMESLPPGCPVPHGLWSQPLSWWLDKVQAEGFNAVRLPLSTEVMEDPDAFVIPPPCLGAEPRFAGATGLTPRTILPVLLDEAWKRGIAVLLDRHTTQGEIQPYPWIDEWTPDRVCNAWTRILSLEGVGTHPALMGIDLVNEPHGQCTLQDAMHYYQKCVQVVERAQTGFDGVYLLAGVQWSQEGGMMSAWGGSLRDLPLVTTAPNHFEVDPSRLVLTVHQYGPDVRGMSQQDWGPNWVRARNDTPWQDVPVILGEWGGFLRPGSGDEEYYTNMIEDLAPLDNFFWTLSPDSGDTGGLVFSDFSTVDGNKVRLINNLQPCPTRLGPIPVQRRLGSTKKNLRGTSIADQV